MELCEATIKLCHQIGTSVALIFFNKQVEGWVSKSTEFITRSLICFIKKQFQQLNIMFLMKLIIVQIPIAMKQIVPNFSKDVML